MSVYYLFIKYMKSSLVFFILILTLSSITSFKLKEKEIFSEKEPFLVKEKITSFNFSEVKSTILKLLESNLLSCAFLLTTVASFTFNKLIVNFSSFIALALISLNNYFIGIRIVNLFLADYIVCFLFLLLGTRLLSEGLGLNPTKHIRKEPNGKTTENHKNIKSEIPEYDANYKEINNNDTEIDSACLEKSALDYLEQQEVYLSIKKDINTYPLCYPYNQLYDYETEETSTDLLYQFSIIFLLVFFGEESSHPQLGNFLNQNSLNFLLISEIGISNILSTMISIAIAILIGITIKEKDLKLFSGILFITYSIYSIILNELSFSKHN